MTLGDRVGNVARLRLVVDANYTGLVSVERFSPATQQNPQIATCLRAILNYVRMAAYLV